MPAGQVVQLAAPLLEYVPPAQVAHDDAPAGLYVPAEQMAPIMPENVVPWPEQA